MSEKTEPKPTMSDDEKRYIAFSGLIKWTQGVIEQFKRINDATKQLDDFAKNPNSTAKPADIVYSMQREQHLFAVTVNRLIEYREWVKELGLCKNVDFSEIDDFSRRNIKDLRNMLEHDIDYFKGKGRDSKRWVTETEEYISDASSRVGNNLGGKLDFVKFTEVANKLLVQLEKQPIPRITDK